MTTSRRLLRLMWLAPLLCHCVAAASPARTRPPATLAETGLYAHGNTLAAGVVLFEPQHALWSDGATKKRWIALPPGTSIDASKPDEWVFPRGTRLWKQFSIDGRPVETRFIRRLADGNWEFASYLWNEEATQARLAPDKGALLDRGSGLPRYAIPSRTDCLACHGNSPTPVLGLAAIQLGGTSAAGTDSAVRDLRALVARGWLRGMPAPPGTRPAIAGRSDIERAALGYLHANCGHCHNEDKDGVRVALMLKQSAADPAGSAAAALRSLLSAQPRYAQASHPSLVVPGGPGDSLLLSRVATRNPLVQMPPLGTSLVDTEAVALLRRWIEELPTTKGKMR